MWLFVTKLGINPKVKETLEQSLLVPLAVMESTYEALRLRVDVANICCSVSHTR